MNKQRRLLPALGSVACGARESREKAKKNLRTKPRSDDAACGEEFRLFVPQLGGEFCRAAQFTVSKKP